ncbi:unnamed protein product [Rhizophagus irregularis]|nr:unnamed protein product [Rhizophagus irregularis]
MYDDQRELTVLDVDELLDTFLWTEKFIEKANFYPEWDHKRTIKNHQELIKWQNISTVDSNRLKLEAIVQLKGFLTTINLFSIPNDDKPQWLQDNLQPQFYKWLDASGIECTNCPLELAELLVSINQVLRGEKKEKIDLLVKFSEESRSIVSSMSKQQLSDSFNKTISSYYTIMEDEKRKVDSLKGQHSTQQSITEKFSFIKGNEETGKAKMDKIEREYVNYLEQQVKTIC